MRFRYLSCLLLLTVCFDAAASDLYATINRLRAGEGNCIVAEKLPPLKPQAALERAARDLARGVKLQPSLDAAGYRETRANAFSITGEGAGARAADMARYNYFDHIGRDGSTAAQRVERAGYRYRATGENLAGGQQSPEDAVANWLESPSHCANLMNPVFTDMGAGFGVDRRSEKGVYWTLTLGAPR